MTALLTQKVANTRAFGADFETVPSTEAALERIASISAAVVPVDEALTDPLSRVPQQILGKILLVGDLASPSVLFNLAGHTAVGGILLRHTPPSSEELVRAVLRLTQKELDPLMSELHSSIGFHTIELTDSTRRGEAIDAIEHFYQPLISDSRLSNQLLTIADELITNAFYNAAVDGMGRRPYASLSRIEPVKCTVDRPILLRYGFDGQRAALSVRDRYGTLERSTLLRTISLCVGDPRGASTAVLGLQTAFRAASRLSFYIVPEKSTEVVGVIDVEGGYRRFIEGGKGFDFFF